MNKIFVFGHKNPDTDSVCGAISLSFLKNKMGINAEPRVIGSINAETKYALKYFNVPMPKFLNDVKIQIKDVNYHKNYLINENSTILMAYNLITMEGITGIPIVDDNYKFVGYVSLKEIASDMICKDDMIIDTKYDSIVKTIGGKSLLKNDEYIKGNIITATDEINTGEEDDILIVGDRLDIIDAAIKNKVNLIILSKTTLNKEQLEKATINKLNVITCSKNSFEISKLLNLSNPIKSIKRSSEVITFNENDYLSDFIEITNNLNHTNYPVLNNKNECIGMIRTIDAASNNKKKVILVDHNMISQSVDGLQEAEILEIIDHHNIGGLNTNQPVSFRNMLVGSVNTIIYYLFMENNVKIPSSIAGIMLSGILSDTLMLKSPTTTNQDKEVARILARKARVSIPEYGISLISSGVSIKGLSPKEIIMNDFKEYKVNDDEFSISQFVTVDINEFKKIKDELINELNMIAKEKKYRVCALFVTNFINNNSYIFYSDNSKKYLETSFKIKEINQGMIFEGVLSRKKQIVPEIMEILM